MDFISQQVGYLFLGSFGFVMILISFFARTKRLNTKNSFLVANRQMGWFVGGISIAASWIWAPALFVSVQLAYEMGLAGIFWFTVPNVIALLMFAFLTPRIRTLMPDGYTLPQFIEMRLKSKRLHTIYLIPYFFYQIMAITVQLFAGGSLIALLTGIPLTVVMPMLLVIALVYTLISGLQASMITDVIQMALIVGIGMIILPWTWSVAGGVSTITAGLSGIAGSINVLDPAIMFSLGIVSSIGLIAGAICDQEYWQRGFAIKKPDLKKAFVFGGLLFGLVPIALSTLGFIAANASTNISLPEGIDTSMIGVQTVATLLPTWAVFLFVVMLLAGLSSTLDSGLSAISSLWATDVSREKEDFRSVRSARLAMIGFGIVGLVIGYGVYLIPQFGLFHLWWIFNAVAATVVVPTILSLYWDRLSSRGVVWGVSIAFLIGLPLFIYGNYIGNNIWIVSSSLFIILVSTIFSLAMPIRESKPL